MSLYPQLCLLAFGALCENKMAPKSVRNANFPKLQRKDKEENTRKWTKKGPQMGPQKGQKLKFRKTQNCSFFSCPKEYYHVTTW